MEEYFLNHEQSLAVKELGFDIETIYVYKTNTILIGNPIKLDYFDYDYRTTTNAYIKSNYMIGWCVAPLKNQFFKWARDKYGMLGVVNVAPQGFYYYVINKIDKYKEINQDVDFDSFEEAEDACINKLIEIIKNK